MRSPSDPTPSDPEAADPTSADPESGDAGPTDTAASRRPSRRTVVIALGVVVAVLVGVLVALQLTSGGQREPFTVVTVTEVVGSPSPATEPVERDTSTGLLAALPGTVLGYAISDQTEATAMLDLHALEGWSLTYTGGGDAVVLQAGQWPTGEEAQDALAATQAVDGAQPVGEPEDVLVGGEAVGSVQTQLLSDGVERTSWRNGTVVFVAEGPEGTTRPFYDAFGL